MDKEKEGCIKYLRDNNDFETWCLGLKTLGFEQQSKLAKDPPRTIPAKREEWSSVLVSLFQKHKKLGDKKMMDEFITFSRENDAASWFQIV